MYAARFVRFSALLVLGCMMSFAQTVSSSILGIIVDPAGSVIPGADIKLTKVRNLSANLTNAEWMLSIPGTAEQKNFLLNCTGCHTLERIMKSTHDADEFMERQPVALVDIAPSLLAE